VSLHIHVLRDGYARSVIFTSLYLFKYIYLTIVCTDKLKLPYKRKLYFQVMLFHISTYDMTNMKFFSSKCYKNSLFSVSRRLCKGSAQMDSDTCVVTNQHRIVTLLSDYRRGLDWQSDLLLLKIDYNITITLIPASTPWLPSFTRISVSTPFILYNDPCVYLQ
jgi:hypothetical protein